MSQLANHSLSTWNNCWHLVVNQCNAKNKEIIKKPQRTFWWLVQYYQRSIIDICILNFYTSRSNKIENISKAIYHYISGGNNKLSFFDNYPIYLSTHYVLFALLNVGQSQQTLETLSKCLLGKTLWCVCN